MVEIFSGDGNSGGGGCGGDFDSRLLAMVELWWWLLRVTGSTGSTERSLATAISPLFPLLSRFSSGGDSSGGRWIGNDEILGGGGDDSLMRSSLVMATTEVEVVAVTSTGGCWRWWSSGGGCCDFGRRRWLLIIFWRTIDVTTIVTTNHVHDKDDVATATTRVGTPVVRCMSLSLKSVRRGRSVIVTACVSIIRTYTAALSSAPSAANQKLVCYNFNRSGNPSALKSKTQSQVKSINPASARRNTNMKITSETPNFAQENQAIKRQKLEEGKARQILSIKPQTLLHKTRPGKSTSNLYTSTAKTRVEDRKLDLALYLHYHCCKLHVTVYMVVVTGCINDVDNAQARPPAKADFRTLPAGISTGGATATTVREREIAKNSDDVGGSGGGIGDLQDSGGCSFGYSPVHGVQEVGGGLDGSPERDGSSWWWWFLLLPVNGEGASGVVAATAGELYHAATPPAPAPAPCYPPGHINRCCQASSRKESFPMLPPRPPPTSCTPSSGE
nr:protein TPX2-like [Ipomoea batatas]